MAKRGASTKAKNTPRPRVLGKVTKVGKGSKQSKSKLSQASKNARAEIDKLNMDITNVQSLHSTLAKAGLAPRPAAALDAKSLREGLKKDNENKELNARAEKDLTAQLELLTGMEI